MKSNRLFLWICIVVLPQVWACKAPYYNPVEVAAERQVIHDNPATQGPEHEAVDNIIAPYRQHLEAAMSEVIGRVETTLTLSEGESSLGNWVSDQLYEEATRLFPDQTIDFAIANRGGLRIQELPAGPIMMEDMYRLMPFDNELVLVKVNGIVMLELLEFMAGRWNGWPQSSQLRYRISDGQAVNVRVNDQPVQLNRNYLVAMPDYIANGGDDASMLSDRPQIKSGRLIRELLILAVNREETITARLDNRIQ